MTETMSLKHTFDQSERLRDQDEGLWMGMAQQLKELMSPSPKRISEADGWGLLTGRRNPQWPSLLKVLREIVIKTKDGGADSIMIRAGSLEHTSLNSIAELKVVVMEFAQACSSILTITVHEQTEDHLVLYLQATEFIPDKTDDED